MQFAVAIWCMSVIYRKFTFPKTFTWAMFTQSIQYHACKFRTFFFLFTTQSWAPLHLIPDVSLCCYLHDYPVAHWCPSWLHELCWWNDEVCRQTVLPGNVISKVQRYTDVLFKRQYVIASYVSLCWWFHFDVGLGVELIILAFIWKLRENVVSDLTNLYLQGLILEEVWEREGRGGRKNFYGRGKCKLHKQPHAGGGGGERARWAPSPQLGTKLQPTVTVW